MKPAADQLRAFERLLDHIRTREEVDEQFASSLTEMGDAIERRDWDKVGEMALEVLASAAYMNFVDDILAAP